MQKEKQKKGTIWIIISILFLIGICVIGWLYMDNKTNMSEKINEKVQENLSMNAELDSIVAEFEDLKQDFGFLNDSLLDSDEIIQQQKARIKQLIAENRGKRVIERELGLLKDRMIIYEHKLDSIFIENQKLTDENLHLTHLYETEQERNYDLSAQNEELNVKATLGEKIKAYNIKATAYKVRGTGKEVSTEKAKRVDRIKICFTIGENLVISPGKKNIYIRVARPDNVVLQKSGSDAYTFDYNGKQIVYSIKQVIDYQNKSHFMCMNWDKVVDGKAMKGTYKVAVFFEGQEVGTTSFKLK